MSCKSAIFLENSGSNTVSEGSTIPMGNVIRRFGCNLKSEGSGIVTDGDGYYKVTAVFSVTSASAGVIGVTLENNGVAVGSASSQYAGAGSAVNLSVVALVRNVCCNSRGFLEFVLSSGSGTVTQSNVVVEKL